MVAEISTRVGSNVRRFRRERDMTQARMVEELAGTGLELSESMLSRLEHGQRTVTVDQLVALAEVLDVAPVDLLDVPVEVPEGPPEPNGDGLPAVVVPAGMSPDMMRMLAGLALVTPETHETLERLMALGSADVGEVLARHIQPLMDAVLTTRPRRTRPVSRQEG